MPDRNLVTCLFVCAAMSIAMVGGTTQTRTLSITRVSVVDVTDGRILPNRTVTITRDTIANVAPDGASRAGAQVVDGQGKFLIPGLWDMHAHVQMNAKSVAPAVYRERRDWNPRHGRGPRLHPRHQRGHRIRARARPAHRRCRTRSSTMRPATGPSGSACGIPMKAGLRFSF